MTGLDDHFDIIVVGSGVAGLTAATVGACEGQRVLLVEKTDYIGGTTAISGGMVWVPANHHMREMGREDSLENARTYLEATVPDGLDPEVKEAFLQRGDEAVTYLENRTDVRFQPVKNYPDYYPDLDGATLGGRVLESVPFDASELGGWFKKLRSPLPDFMLFGGMMVSRADIPHWRRFAKSTVSALRVLKLVSQYLCQRTRHSRGTSLYLGNALTGRLLLSANRAGVTICTSAEVTSLVMENGVVRGAEVNVGGAVREIRADKGVVLATGGFSHDAELRRRYLPKQLATSTATVGNSSTTGGARLGIAINAAIADSRGGGFWTPASVYKDSSGATRYFPHTVTDRGKPGLIAVNQRGVRFTNEARSYHEFVKAQLSQDELASPAWLICDSKFLWKYGLGRVKPFTLKPSQYIRDGYLKKGASLSDLAKSIGLPVSTLLDTVRTFNEDARVGIDRAFGRGSDAYQRHLGDADVKPNPCVAPIETGPFYAVAVYPADLGTATGLTTDANARVLSTNGDPIPGLYACGNDMASIMNGAYPGPGITIGPALVFGYIAAQHCAKSRP